MLECTGACTLSVSTSDAAHAGTKDAVVHAQFLINQTWQEPLMFYRGDLDKKQTANMTYILGHSPDEIRLIMEPNSNRWGIWRITLDCFESCRIVVLLDPNGEEGTPFDGGDLNSPYWMGTDGAGTLNQTYRAGE